MLAARPTTHAGSGVRHVQRMAQLPQPAAAAAQFPCHHHRQRFEKCHTACCMHRPPHSATEASCSRRRLPACCAGAATRHSIPEERLQKTFAEVRQFSTGTVLATSHTSIFYSKKGFPTHFVALELNEVALSATGGNALTLT